MRSHSLLQAPTTRSECQAIVLLELRRGTESAIEPDALASLDDATLGAAARRLNRWREACGCATGATFAFAALAFRVFVIVRARVPSVHDAARDLVVAGGWVLTAAALGKLAGLAVARACRRVETERLVRRLARISGEGLRHVVLR